MEISNRTTALPVIENTRIEVGNNIKNVILKFGGLHSQLTIEKSKNSDQMDIETTYGKTEDHNYTQNVAIISDSDIDTIEICINALATKNFAIVAPNSKITINKDINFRNLFLEAKSVDIRDSILPNANILSDTNEIDNLEKSNNEIYISNSTLNNITTNGNKLILVQASLQSLLQDENTNNHPDIFITDSNIGTAVINYANDLVVDNCAIKDFNLAYNTGDITKAQISNVAIEEEIKTQTENIKNVEYNNIERKEKGKILVNRFAINSKKENK